MLPRPLRAFQEWNEDGQLELVETDVVLNKADMYDDFDRMRREIGIKR